MKFSALTSLLLTLLLPSCIAPVTSTAPAANQSPVRAQTVSQHPHSHSIDTSSRGQNPKLIAQGKRTFELYKRDKPRVRNSQVQRVGNRLKRVIHLPEAEWEFVTFKNATPNAFALPGGKIGVHDSILKISKTDAGLATILAHEIAHVSRGHHADRMQKNSMIGVGTSILGSVIGGGDYNRLFGLGGNLLALKFSRNNEYEADQVGLIYMAKAGYDPREAVRFWERFSQYKQSKGSSGSDFLSTHPLDSRRIAALKQFMPTALEAYRQGN